jgi:hypothetical protein
VHTALQIDPDGTVETISLPDDYRRSIVARLSGSPDLAPNYNRRAALWVHGNGVNENLPPNYLATAVATAWCRRDVSRDASYFLPGRVIITGQNSEGDLVELKDELADQVRAIAQAISPALTAGTATWGEIVQLASAALARGESPS